MLDRSETVKISNPQFALRQNFFPLQSDQRILTNHFEYSINTGTVFYEYKILDLGTKNRKKLKELFRNAMENWSFLRQNEKSFATNYIYTIVSWKKLHTDLGSGESIDVNSIEWGRSIRVGDNDIPLRFRYVKDIPIHDLERYAAADPSYEYANFDEIAKCLNWVISRSFNSHVHKLSANKFFVKTARVPLKAGSSVSDSLEIVRGYFYNVKPGMGNIILNFNISTSAVFRTVNVADFLNDNSTFPADKVAHVLTGKNLYVDLDRSDPDLEKQARLNSEESRYWKFCELQRDGNIEQLTFRKKVMKDGKFIKRTNETFQMKDKDTFVVEHLTFRKKVMKDGKFIKRTNETFQMKDKDTFVVDHLAQVFGKPPVQGRPAVNVGSRQSSLPYTRPVPDKYTSSMVNEACRNPTASRAYIENEGLRTLGFTTTGDAVAFKDIPLQLHSTMLQVPRMVIPFPRKIYRGQKGNTTQAMDASRWRWPWDLESSEGRFYTTAPKKLNYVVIATPGCHPTSPGYYSEELEKHFSKCGLTEQQVTLINPKTIEPQLKSTKEDDLRATLNEASTHGAKLVVLVMEKYDLTTYRDFKSLADREVGMQSICLVENSKDDKIFRGELMTNVMMKMNLKLGGVNHVVAAVEQRLKKTTMILGADLVHPGPGAFPGTPSIASIVVSVDDHAGKCLGSMRLQTVDKTDREVIGTPDSTVTQELTAEIMDANTVIAMVTERLQAWAAVHPSKDTRLPDNIIYYRDGVSGGHYSKVQETELVAIRKAYEAMRAKEGIKPKVLNLTAVIVTKRHHTRFYPIAASDKDRFGNSNCKPGTRVDKLVTSPYYQDFYLQSHSGIKGTARPSHYFALENNVPGLTLEALRDLTHNLSYSYVRSMTPVSYVSPTYYADRLCERGRLYIRKYFNGDDKALWDELNTFKNELENRLRDARDQKSAETSIEKEMEKMHGEEVAKETQDFIFKKIAKEFYREWDEYAPETSAGNPWANDIGETMFWM